MTDLDKWLLPFWKGNMIYDEAVTFVKQNGVVSAPLLFDATEIISVKSADHSKTYERGSDWDYVDGCIVVHDGSGIFYFDESELCMDKSLEGHSFPMPNGKHSLFYEGHFFHDRQTVITYKHNSTWSGYIPQFAGESLPRTMKCLTEDKHLKLILFGDSISEGSNASSKTGVPPYMPQWGELVAEKLRHEYGAQVDFKNPSKGGMTSEWGIGNVDELVCTQNPDLVIIAFGMNDGLSGEKFYNRIKTIVDKIKEKCPLCEFVLIATMEPNRQLTHPKARYYREQCYQKNDICRLLECGTAMVSMYDVQQVLLQKKRFIDLTGNNVNHPNDFMIRAYAQSVLNLLIK